VIGKTDGVIGEDFGFPNDFAETFEAAMEVMVALVLGELVKAAIETESPIGDAVGVASYRATEVRIVLLPLLFTLEANQNVFKTTLTIRDAEAAECGTQGMDGSGDSGGMGEGNGHF
jgi:hypothetical protein